MAIVSILLYPIFYWTFQISFHFRLQSSITFISLPFPNVASEFPSFWRHTCMLLTRKILELSTDMDSECMFVNLKLKNKKRRTFYRVRLTMKKKKKKPSESQMKPSNIYIYIHLMCKLSDKLWQKLNRRERRRNEWMIKTIWLNTTTTTTKKMLVRIFYEQIIRFIWYIELCVPQIFQIKHENAQSDTQWAAYI